MRNIGIILVIFLALVCGAAASVMAYYYLKNNPGEKGPELTPVVVASHDLTFGETLEPQDMRVVMYPATSVPKNAYAEIDSLKGQITKVFLKENEPILNSKLSSIGGGLSLLIEPNMRAASIQVDKVSGVSGFILPGDMVDVILTVDDYGSRRDAMAKTILQKVEVLAAGEKTEQKGDKVITVQAVTLLVDAKGVQDLALASQEGKLHLALRNRADNEVVPMSPISKTEILKDNAKPKPKPAPKVTKPRVVVKKEEPVKESDSLVIFRGAAKKTEVPAMAEEKVDRESNK
ncbi:MAG TPA: Flp pilus assembly protein CpaB [candidate division Zixibacteria bacterium]|nr:Flp pilus assembly protein CpaB [candidate division Zixibacteria bacterium]HEQ97725.1 Flp pilus assembly protein CpaB [candidate division Zixibacteria bacterium]